MEVNDKDIPQCKLYLAISPNAEQYPLNAKKYQNGERYPRMRMGSDIPERTNNIRMGSRVISPNANGEQYDDIAECERGAMQSICCTTYAILNTMVLIFDVRACALVCKKIWFNT